MCHTHSILVIVELTLSASAMAPANSTPILLLSKLHDAIYNIHCAPHHYHGPEYYIHRIRRMPYSLYTGYCCIELERLRNGSRSFVSNTIESQAAKCNIQHSLCLHHIIIMVQGIISTGFSGCHTHSILVIVALTLSASAMARAPSTPILLNLKLQNVLYNIHCVCTTSFLWFRVSYINRNWWMPYSLYIGYCHVDLKRLRNGSRSFDFKTIVLQAA
jgi:hypothetical protein